MGVFAPDAFPEWVRVSLFWIGAIFAVWGALAAIWHYRPKAWLRQNVWWRFRRRDLRQWNQSKAIPDNVDAFAQAEKASLTTLIEAEKAPCAAALANLERFFAGPLSDHILSLKIAGGAPDKLTALVDQIVDLRTSGDELRGDLVKMLDRDSHCLATIMQLDMAPVTRALEMLYNPCQRVLQAKDWPPEALKDRAVELAAANGRLENEVSVARRQIADRRKALF
jgi:hypothetical protein